MKRLLFLVLLWAALPAAADETVMICYNYGCAVQAPATFNEEQLSRVRETLAEALDAGQEREALARVLGQLYGWAGEQLPIAKDRGGDYADDGVDGRMDCIDHATSSTQLLHMIEARGWLRFHRVAAPARRTRFLIIQHFSAVVEELTPEGVKPVSASPPKRFAIDSWFRDNGQPAVVMPIDDWLGGAYPDV